MLYVGIDPGQAGGIAVIRADGSVVTALKMPASERDVLDTLSGFQSAEAPVQMRAALEHVWSIPGQGGAFAFGKNVGLCLAALLANRIPFDQVLPRAWQKALGVVYAKGATDTEKKNLTKRRAQQLFPAMTVTHAIADALLLAEYARRQDRHGDLDEAGTPSQDAVGTRNHTSGFGSELGSIVPSN